MCGLTSMSIPELAGLMEELGQPKFRARQVLNGYPGAKGLRK